MKFFVTAGFFLSVFVQAYTQVNLKQGLIAYYPFNGNALDGSGNNNNAIHNSATLTTDRFGNTGSAYYFDGIDDYITIPGSTTLNSPNAMSVALYFNPEQTTVQTLIGKINYLLGNGTQFQVATNFGLYPGVLFGVNNPADNCNNQIVLNSSYVNTGGTVPLNQWYCVVSTFEAGVQKIYLNGTLISTTTAPFNTLKQCSNSDIHIGTWWDSDKLMFKGKIDDIRIYNRALTVDEVAALCTSCSNPVSDFTFKQDICNPLTVQFSGEGAAVTNPQWDFGDGGTATTLKPGHTYANTGNYTVRYSVDRAGCRDYHTKTISVDVTNADIIATPDTTICAGSPAQLRAKPALSFCWSPTTYLTNANTPNPTTTATQNITYYYNAEVPGANLITNGDFSSGNTAFTSQYAFTNSNVTQGEYFVGALPQSWNALLADCRDHTTGNGNMLIVNGATIANVQVWTQTINITPNTNYTFSAWLQNINVHGTGSNPPQLQFAINGIPVGNVLQGSISACNWQQFYVNWNSGSSTKATISIVNQNTIASGNDFALDDISFSPVTFEREAINVTVSPCIATARFTTPDTVCVNTPVAITNTSTGASSYYWNFCVADINSAPARANIGNPGNLLTGPVFIDYAYDNGNYYGFVVSFTQARLVRLDFGNSLLNTPTAVNLGNYGLLQNSGSEGIQIVKNEGKWYALIVGGSLVAGTQPRIIKIDFGTNITSAGTATNWGNIGNLNQPIDLHVFKEGNNWYGFTVNSEDNTITRFNFTNSFNNTPTGTNLGNIGGLAYPTGIYAINDNGFWRVFITNGGDNQRDGTNSSLTRLDFGSSLLNTPTGVNLGNPGNILRHPRDFTIMKFCGGIVGFAVNGNPSYNDLVRMNFSNNLTLAPTATSLGNTGGLNFPHSLSKLFRVNDDVYAFITNVANSTITRIRFQGCTNASVSSSTDQHPQPVTYSTPGTYNINLTIDDGLPTQTSYCKQVVVMPAPVHTPTKAIDLCTGDSVKTGTGVKYAQYTWNTGATTDSVWVKTAGTYWVQTDRYGCSNRDSMIVTELPKPVVDLGPDASFCTQPTMALDAGNSGASYLWQDGYTAQTRNVTSFGKYYVRVTSPAGCISSDTITLTQVLFAQADFTFKQDICNPLTVTFTGVGNNLMNPYWAFGDGNTTTGSLTATNTYANKGSYTVKFGIETGGCKDTITKIINVDVTQSDLIITPDTTICFNTTKQLRARPALSFCWSPATGLSDPTLTNPVTSTQGKTTYYYTAEVTGTNLVRNNDFSNGNSDFTSSYQYNSSGVNPGVYFVGPDPATWHPGMSACKDHTTGTGNMLLVNGAQQTNVSVWSQTIAITPNTNYAFSAWLQHITTVNPARLQFSINNIPIGNVFQANSTSCIWDRFYSVWNSGNNTSATISIINMNQVFSGNDFALDDISFAPLFIQRDSVIISVDTPVVIARADTTICPNGQVPMYAAGAATWSWTPTAGLSSTTISNPFATPANTTEYIVTGTTIYGCQAKDTVNINVFPIPTVITDRVLNTCPETPLQLTANNILTGWSWTPAAGLTSTTISNPVATPAVNTEYIVNATTTDGCAVKDTLNVNLFILPTVVADRDVDACPNTPVQLSANNTLANWSWAPAAGLTSTSISNPVATPDVDTKYIVTGTTTDGCAVKDSVTITLYSLPLVLADRMLDACPNTSVQLAANNTLASWSWAPAAGLNSTTISNPVATPAVNTEYIVTGITSDGCTAKDTIDINLYPVPTVIADHDLVACPNTPVQLAANNTLVSWSWSPALYLNNTNIANPTANLPRTLTYRVQVKDINNCTHTDTVHVEVLDTRFTLTGLNRPVCQGASVTLQATGGDSWLWSPAGSLNNATIATPVATPDTSTLYTVYAKESTCGTDTTMQVRVTVNPSPVVHASKDNDVNCVVHTARLHATGTPGTSYLWAPVTGLDHANLPDPVSGPHATTTYFVTGTNQHGCSAVDSVTVQVEAEGKVTFMVPNAFSPNGDGRNDCFGVKSWGGATIEEFSVFNRWGERVFSSKNATACWDGRFKGELQPAGGYVYVIKAKTICGNIKRTGTMVLVR